MPQNCLFSNFGYRQSNKVSKKMGSSFAGLALYHQSTMLSEALEATVEDGRTKIARAILVQGTGSTISENIYRCKLYFPAKLALGVTG